MMGAMADLIEIFRDGNHVAFKQNEHGGERTDHWDFGPLRLRRLRYPGYYDNWFVDLDGEQLWGPTNELDAKLFLARARHLPEEAP